jgi:murein DD-endopeptidase MepM/ murein hydrolase activator NlpD
MKKNLKKGNRLITSEYIWPISRSASPDEINTSFGPRINNDRWQFHRGMDLPFPERTPVYAMHSGSIYLAGEGNSHTFKSRHVVIKVRSNTKDSRALFLIYLHLSKISKDIKKGVEVEKGDYLGNVGSDDATYPHLHIEFRRANNEGKLDNRRIKHPLNHLPYPGASNFHGKLTAKFQKSGVKRIKARLSFRGINKNQGDLMGVEVSLFKNGSVINKPKIVNFDKALTINKSGVNDDKLIFNNQGIGLEGYQKSNMVSQGYDDLHYGILIKSIPYDCDYLSAKAFDVRSNVTVWPDIPISQPSPIEQSLDFEDGLMPPAGWKVVRTIVPISSNGQSGSTHVYNEAIAAYSGQRGMLCRVDKFSGPGSRAAIEYNIPYDQYFELFVEAMINPRELQLSHGNSIYPFYFLNELNSLSVAAGIYHSGNKVFQTRLIAKDSDGIIKHSEINGKISVQEWKKWRLELRRVGTRTTTAILYLGDKNNSTSFEIATISYDSRPYGPKKLRVGIGFCSPSTSGTIFSDNVRLSGKV